MCICMLIFAAYTLHLHLLSLSFSPVTTLKLLSSNILILPSLQPPSTIYSFIIFSCVFPDRARSFPFIQRSLLLICPPRISLFFSSLKVHGCTGISPQLQSTNQFPPEPVASLSFFSPLTSHLFFSFFLYPHIYLMCFIFPFLHSFAAQSMPLTSAVFFNLSLLLLPVHLLYLLSCYLSHFLSLCQCYLPICSLPNLPLPPCPHPSPPLFSIGCLFYGNWWEAAVVHLEL